MSETLNLPPRRSRLPVMKLFRVARGLLLYRRGRPLATAALALMLTLSALSEWPPVLPPLHPWVQKAVEVLGSGVSDSRRAMFDKFQQVWPRQRQSQPVTIVAIDEASLAAEGQWPWSRDRLAALIDAVAAHRPAAIGLDIYMPEVDRTSPSEVAARLPPEASALAEGLRQLPNHDRLLAQALAQSPSVLSAAGFDHAAYTTRGGMRSAPVLLRGGDAWPSTVRTFPQVLASLPMLQAAALGQAVVSVDLEMGVVRRMPLVVRIAEQPVAALAMEMFRVATGSPSVTIDLGRWGVEAVGVADLRVPTSVGGEILLHFAPLAAGEKRYASAIDVLQGKLPSAMFEGKLVLLGLTGAGLNDMRTTALNELVPGIEIQAQALESIFDGRILRRPWWMLPVELVAALLIGALLIVVVPAPGSIAERGLRRYPKASAAVALVIQGALIAASFALFVFEGLLLDATAFSLTLGVVAACLVSSLLARIALEASEAERASLEARIEEARREGERRALERLASPSPD